jgi:hypothetical protein
MNHGCFMWRSLHIVLLAMSLAAATALAEGMPVRELVWAGERTEMELGFGWSRGESEHRWITRAEADLWFDLPAARELTFRLQAAVPYLHWRRQRIGLYVNGRWVAEWPAADDPEFHDYTVVVPAAYVVAGRNRLTLRMAYTTHIGRDQRLLALAVRTVTLEAADR